MRLSMKSRMALCALVLSLPCAAQAQSIDCVSSLASVSQPTVMPNHAAGAVAWNDAAAQLGVAKTDNGTLQPIFFATYDQNLAQVSADRQVAADSLAGPIALLWTGQEFGLFYQNQSLQPMLQRLAGDGTPIGSSIPLATRHPNFPGEELEVVFDPFRNAYVLLHTYPQGSDAGLWMTVIAPTGEQIFDNAVSYYIAHPTNARVAVGSNGTLGIVYERHDDTGDSMYFLSIDATNFPSVSQPISATGSNPRIAWNGTNFAVVLAAKVTGGTEIHWIRLDGRGVVVSTDRALIPARGVDATPVHLLWNTVRSEWALSYLDSATGFANYPGDYRLRRFNSAGAVLSDTLFSNDDTKRTFPSFYPFADAGSIYFSSLDRFVSQAQGSDSYLAKLCPLTGLPVVSQSTININVPVTFSAFATGGSPEYSYNWDFGDFTEQRPEQSIRHSYSRTGTYLVTLTVTDAAGGTSVSTTTVTVIHTRRRPTGH